MKQLPISSPGRVSLIRWAGWFSLIHLILFCMIGSLNLFQDILHMHLHQTLNLSRVIGGLILLGLLSLMSLGLLTLMTAISCIIPRRFFIGLIAVILGTCLTSFFLGDAIIYHLYHTHVGTLIIDSLRASAFKQVFDLSPYEWIWGLLLIGFITLLEIFLAWMSWRLSLKSSLHILTLLGSMALIFIPFSFASYWELRDTTHPTLNKALLQATLSFPYYTKFLERLLPIPVNHEMVLPRNPVHHGLTYPLKPLICATPQQPYNVVIIALDTWRFDMLNAAVAPNIESLAQRSWEFTNHLSGGNWTQPGIFSLFYGLPATYWEVMAKHRRGPVLIQQLLADHYQMGIFASASLHFPEFDKTVFHALSHSLADTTGATAAERDMNITNEFHYFLMHRNQNRPFFSFLFYDEVHNWCGSDQPYARPFQPAISVCNRLFLTKNTPPLPYLNRYKNAVYFVDWLVGQDLSWIQAQHLLDHTVIIVTADHGEEFNDSHQGYWGHASAFDPSQIQTPLIIFWPNKSHQIFANLTTHFDVVPTLMQGVLGCKNPTSDYSVGNSLLKNEAHVANHLIVGGDNTYAVLEPHSTITVFPTQNFGVLEYKNNQFPMLLLNTKQIQDLQNSISEFHRYDSSSATR